MDCMYYVSAAQRFGVVTPIGSHTLDSLRQIVDRLLAHPAWRPGFDLLVDARGMHFDEEAKRAMSEISAMVGGRLGEVGPGRTAFVVVGAGGKVAMTLYSILRGSDARTRRVFESIDGAYDWLGRDPAVVGG